MSNPNQKSKNKVALNAKQTNAIDMLVQGKTASETAKAVAVSSSTLARWQTENPHFIVELNKKRRELWASSQQRLRALIPKALDVLDDALLNGDAKTASFIIKITNDFPEPGGFTSVESWLDAQAESTSLQTFIDSLSFGDKAASEQKKAELKKKWC